MRAKIPPVYLRLNKLGPPQSWDCGPIRTVPNGGEERQIGAGVEESECRAETQERFCRCG